MADPIIVTIGGAQIELPPILVFEDLERIWPAMKALDATTDPIERTSCRLAIISGALKATRPELTIPELKKRLRIDRYDEISGLADPVIALLEVSGLLKKDDPPGEGDPPAIPAEAMSPTGST